MTAQPAIQQPLDAQAVVENAPRSGLIRTILRTPTAVVPLVFLVVVVVLGLLAPVIAPFSPNFIDLNQSNAAPFSGSFVLGGDQTGRDVLSRLLVATLGTLESGVVLLVVSLVLGVGSGLAAGYLGGKFDTISGWLANVILTLPGFVLLVALYSLVGPQITVSMAVFGVLIAPSFFWLVRTLVLSVRNELYIDAARVAGLSDTRIILRHVLRAIRGPIIVQSSFILAAGIGIQAGLQFLGLGDPAEPSWGGMLNDAFKNIYLAPLNIVWPAVLISLVTLALVLIGNSVRDILQSSGTRHAALAPREVERLRTEWASDHPSIPMADGDGEPPLLEVHDLVVGYPSSATSVQPVVRSIDLTVRRGEIHGLVGESGSGKSQIAFSVLGILPKEAVVLGGAIQFAGTELIGDPRALGNVRGRQIAYIPQEPMSNLDPTFTVGQQLSYGLRAVKRISRKQAKEELIALLDRVGIRDPGSVYDRYPHQISGGMAQRVLIAGAIAGDPELIIADEPTTALDVTVQADVLDLLRGLQRERNLGMVLVTHNFGVVADICDRVSVMRQGRIVESKSAVELFAHPEHEYTRMLLGASLADAAPRPPLRSGAHA